MSVQSAGIKLGLLGAGGRMGRELLRVLPEFPDFSLVCAVVKSGSKNLEEQPALYSSNLKESVSKADLWIDFSTPQISCELAELCAELKKPLLIGTTGHSSSQISTFQKLSAHMPLLLAANTSALVFLLKKLSVEARAFLGKDFDIEILESHHRNKKDAPSGTALALAQNLAQRFDLKLNTSRSDSSSTRTDNEIGICALRGGDVVGEHSILFLGKGERVEISHRVTDRAIFARGALRLAQVLFKLPPGLYSADQLFEKMS